MKHPFPAVSGITLCLALSATALAQEVDTRLVSAQLSSAQEVPPVTGSGSGTIVVDFDDALSQATFSLSVAGTNPVTVAHLHCARAGVPGPIVVTLFTASVPEGDAPAAPLAEGTITNQSITDPVGDAACGVPINNVASLFAAMRDGLIYANAHTPVNPDGEIRGQLFTNDCLRTGAPQAPTSGSPGTFGSSPPPSGSPGTFGSSPPPSGSPDTLGSSPPRFQ